ncbi:MAG TPA: WecB/TagA/CpsF family glycosyltransferase [Verrucomicrobiae bacterium]|jgi:exopolysaccharide biosynthesis WecB/TagA/CpsF family protein/anti-anti-sigma factor|nr:WecB/TagA/CpsF family glycosyltransferase [Verrucomicrobiae bacterium]
MLDKVPVTLFPRRPPVAILGVPFDNVTTSETLDAIEQMVESKCPHYVVTANMDFLALARRDNDLRRIFAGAHLVLCDGTPVLWASRLLGNTLAERVAGSDLVPLLLHLAAEKEYRVFFLGASQKSAEMAVARVRRAFPSLIVVGQYSPPFAPLEEMDHDEILRRIREANPHIVLVAFGCPKAEKWMAMHYMECGVPVMMGVGGTIDFLAGRFQRAPGWMQRSGLEWMYRLGQEPQRLWRRYATDFWVFGTKIMAQWARLRGGIPVVREHLLECAGGNFVVDLTDVKHINSAGIGFLLLWRKRLSAAGRQLILACPSDSVRRSLDWMGLGEDFVIANDFDSAVRFADSQTSIGRKRPVRSEAL